jgi:hypothetical protein
MCHLRSGVLVILTGCVLVLSGGCSEGATDSDVSAAAQTRPERRAAESPHVDRPQVVLIAIDGMEPILVDDLLAGRRLPNI